MKRRLFALLLALAPAAALAEETPRAPRRKLVEKRWDELTTRQRLRLLAGFGQPTPNDDEARTRWDGMTARQRRAVARAAREAHKQQ